MKEWIVETRATVTRRRRVKALDQKAAEAKSSEAAIEYEEDENEETMSIVEVK